MGWLRNGFFWGPPSHRSIAWIGALSGLLVVALAVYLFALGHGAPVFLVALLLVGLANFGWAAELLPRRLVLSAAWARVARWMCALAGSALAILSVVLGVSFGLVFGLIIAGGALMQAFEFAPGGPANHP
jgi:hypothetical protein